MNDDEVAGFLHRGPWALRRAGIAAGENPDEARRIARLQTKEHFPTAGRHRVNTLLGDGRRRHGREFPRGSGPVTPENGPPFYWVWDVAIDEAERGRVYGRAAMALAEEAARAQGPASWA